MNTQSKQFSTWNHSPKLRRQIQARRFLLWPTSRYLGLVYIGPGSKAMEPLSAVWMCSFVPRSPLLKHPGGQGLSGGGPARYSAVGWDAATDLRVRGCEWERQSERQLPFVRKTTEWVDDFFSSSSSSLSPFCITSLSWEDEAFSPGESCGGGMRVEPLFASTLTKNRKGSFRGESMGYIQVVESW